MTIPMLHTKISQYDHNKNVHKMNMTKHVPRSHFICRITSVYSSPTVSRVLLGKYTTNSGCFHIDSCNWLRCLSWYQYFVPVESNSKRGHTVLNRATIWYPFTVHKNLKLISIISYHNFNPGCLYFLIHHIERHIHSHKHQMSTAS